MERVERPVGKLLAEYLERLLLGGRRERAEREVLVPPVGCQLLGELVLPVGGALLSLRLDLGVLLQRVPLVRQRRLELEGARSRLAGMGLVDDDGEPLALVLHLVVYDGELLQGRDHEASPVVQGVAQVRRGLVLAYRHHAAYGVVEARDRVLQLAVEYAPVGDDDHRVEQWLVVDEERREPVRSPGDAVRLARASRVLYEVVLAGAVRPDVGDDPPHGIELVVAGEDNALLLALHLPAELVLFRLLLDLQVEELVDDVEQAVLLKGNLPQMRDWVTIGVGRVARAAVVSRSGGTLVERQEASRLSFELGGHIGGVEVDREERHHSAVELEAGLVWVTVMTPLVYRIVDVLAGELVLELYADHGDAVDVEDHVQSLVAARREVELADAAACVHGIALAGGLVEAGFRLEVRDLERDAAVLEPVLQDVHDAVRVDVVLEHLRELEGGVGVTYALEPLPALRLGGLDEAHERGNVDAAPRQGRVSPVDQLPVLAVYVEQRLLVRALEIAALGRAEEGLNVFLKDSLFRIHDHS